MSNIDESLDNELSHVFKWMVINRLSLNMSKNNFRVLHPYQKDVTGIIPNFFINGLEIERGNSVDFLGITLDENITWKSYIVAIANKLSEYAGIFNKLKNYLPAYILRMLYCNLVNSHLSYGISFWGYECHRLEKNQKTMIRIITVSKLNAHIEPLFKALDLLKIQDMLDLRTLKFYYRYVHDNLPAYFNSFRIVTQGIHHNYDTRNRDQIHIDRTRTRHADKRVHIYLPTVLNSTPTALLGKMPLTVSRGSPLILKKYFIHQYSDICSIPNCDICHHNLTWLVIVVTCVTCVRLFVCSFS